MEMPDKGKGHHPVGRGLVVERALCTVAWPRKDYTVRRSLAIICTLLAAFVGSIFVSAGVASADPSAANWAAVRQCESSGRYNIDTGTGYYGAYQFDLPTWRSVGGTGLPSNASPTEQDYRALLLYRMRGWSPWVCATLIGLKNDSDARSGVTPPVPGNQGSGSTTPEGTGSTTASGAPAYPGRQFNEGDSSESLKAWQRQMGARGYGLTGTGYFGPKTKAVVLRLQKENGLNVVGYIGPKTWAAAWATSAAVSTPAATSTYTPATSATCSVGSSRAPKWAGVTFNPGDTAQALQCWQKQMGHRGYGLIGTGFYGPATKDVVVALQRRNGLNPSGILGPKTWVAAWEGK
jgi:peptidoglycan hydrolase-like protein with peptidoglycan-binding domain